MFSKAFGLTACLFLVAVATAFPAYSAKQVLYIDSYHEGFEWSDGITAAVKSVMGEADVNLKIFRMHTKRNTGEAYKKQVALQARDLISAYHPDVA